MITNITPQFKSYFMKLKTTVKSKRMKSELHKLNTRNQVYFYLWNLHMVSSGVWTGIQNMSKDFIRWTFNYLLWVFLNLFLANDGSDIHLIAIFS